MTVAELITELQKLDQQTKVCIEDSYYGNLDLNDVRKDNERDGTVIFVLWQDINK